MLCPSFPQKQPRKATPQSGTQTPPSKKHTNNHRSSFQCLTINLFSVTRTSAMWCSPDVSHKNSREAMADNPDIWGKADLLHEQKLGFIHFCIPANCTILQWKDTDFASWAPKSKASFCPNFCIIIICRQGMSACTGIKAKSYYREQLLELYFFLANLDSWEQIMARHCCIFPAMGEGLGIPQGMCGSDPVMSVCFGSATSKVPWCPVCTPLLQTTLCIY